MWPTLSVVREVSTKDFFFVTQFRELPIYEMCAKHNVYWKAKLDSIYTYRATLGNTSDFAALEKKGVFNVAITHSFLHRYILASRTLCTFLKGSMST